LTKEENVFKKGADPIANIITKWAGDIIEVYYFFEGHSIPFRWKLAFADNLSAIEFLILFNTLLRIDYESAPPEIDRRANVFDFIATRVWQPVKKPVRPMAIDITLYTGHRMMFVYFRKPAEPLDHRLPPIGQIEFLTEGDLVQAIRFLDDLFEPNSSSKENGIKQLLRDIVNGGDLAASIVYTLKNPVHPSYI
jgi:hypothetical protein